MSFCFVPVSGVAACWRRGGAGLMGSVCNQHLIMVRTGADCVAAGCCSRCEKHHIALPPVWRACAGCSYPVLRAAFPPGFRGLAGSS